MPAPLQPAHRRRAPGGRAQRRRQPGGRRIQPPHHTAQLADELSPTLRGIVERQAVGDRLHSLPEPGEREQEIVERHPQPAGPDGVAPELIREPQHGRRPGLGVEPPGEQREQLVRRAARGGERVVQVLLHQLPARRREQIVAVLKRQAERRQQPAAVLVEPEQEALHPEHAHLGAEVRRGDVLEMMRLVEHQPAVGRQDRGLLPVIGRDPHREVAREQVVVHDDDVRFRRAAPRLEQEAALEVGALEPRAEIRFRRHRVPHLGARLVRKVREGAVTRSRRPGGERLELRRAVVVEQGAPRVPGLREPREADVIPPPLEQREAGHTALSAPRGKRAGENRKVLADQLFLQVDRVGGDDRPLAVLSRPHQRRDEIGERLPHSRARLEQRDAAVVVDVGDVGGHVALARPVLEAAERPRDRTPRREQPGDVERVEPGGRARAGTLDHHVEIGHVVVDDAEPDSAVVHPGGHAQIGPRRLEHAARMVVEQHLAALGRPREGEDRVDRAAGDDPRLDDRAVRVGARDERHLPPVGRRDFPAQQLADLGREALDAHVFSSRFLAAGKSTLLRMSR